MLKWIIRTPNEEIILYNQFPNSEHYYKHCQDRPAILQYQDDELIWESWWFNNKCHRLNGSANTYYDKCNVIGEEYYINGIKYYKEEYDELIFKEKLQML